MLSSILTPKSGFCNLGRGTTTHTVRLRVGELLKTLSFVGWPGKVVKSTTGHSEGELVVLSTLRFAHSYSVHSSHGICISYVYWR